MSINKPLLGSIFTVKTANDTIESAKNQKDPLKLWDEFWYEGEVCCLFADTNVGKSILAVQIGNHIANMLQDNETVAYYDFELSEKQFGLRYTDEKTKKTFNFSDKFIRIILNTDDLKEYCQEHNETLDDVIMQGIESNIQELHTKVVIVDNISWLTNMKSTGNTAANLMVKLTNLKRKYNLSILVLAHTPKRNLGKPITVNNLSGSKTFSNFFDSMFAVGKAICDPNLRYLKQIKVRIGSFTYDTNHVKTCCLDKTNSFLGFKPIGFSDEKNLLSDKGEFNSDNANKKISKKKIVKRKLGRENIKIINKLVASEFDSINNCKFKTF